MTGNIYENTPNICILFESENDTNTFEHVIVSGGM